MRKSVTNDLHQLNGIARRTIDAAYRTFLGDDNVDWYVNSGASDRYVSDNLDDCWVLDTEDGIKGFCVCKGNVIDLIMVDHRFHRRGYGTRMLQYCEAHLLETHDELTLESFEKNDQANAFYRKHQWIERERLVDADLGTTKIVFTKTNIL